MTSIAILLVVKHVLADAYLQTRYNWVDKGRLLSLDGWLHAGSHGALTALILYLCHRVYADLIVLDFVSHYCIDYAKTNLIRRSALTRDDACYWVITAVDQMLHFAVYSAILLALTVRALYA